MTSEQREILESIARLDCPWVAAAVADAVRAALADLSTCRKALHPAVRQLAGREPATGWLVLLSGHEADAVLAAGGEE